LHALRSSSCDFYPLPPYPSLSLSLLLTSTDAPSRRLSAVGSGLGRDPRRRRPHVRREREAEQADRPAPGEQAKPGHRDHPGANGTLRLPREPIHHTPRPSLSGFHVSPSTPSLALRLPREPIHTPRPSLSGFHVSPSTPSLALRLPREPIHPPPRPSLSGFHVSPSTTPLVPVPPPQPPPCNCLPMSALIAWHQHLARVPSLAHMPCFVYHEYGGDDGFRTRILRSRSTWTCSRSRPCAGCSATSRSASRPRSRLRRPPP
jgi:hypothetical protein